MRIGVVACVGCGLLFITHAAAWAQGDASDRTVSKRRDTADTSGNLDARLTFLQQRIARQRLHAEIWWWGFTSLYFVGAMYQGTTAYSANNRATQADRWVSFVKAVGGTVKFAVQPFNGIQAFAPDSSPPSEERKRASVARGERILLHNAEHTEPFGPWYAHILNLGINAAGGVVVGAGFGGWEEGMISAGIGFAVGEVEIVSAPWEADGDIDEYRERFEGRGSNVSTRNHQVFQWSFQPMGAGLSWHASF